MSGFSVRLSLWKLTFVLVAAAVLTGGLTFLAAGEERAVLLQTEQSRRNYICSLGYSPAKGDEETAEITIPREFSEVYENYNALQKEAGFDLEAFKGKSAVRYTYSLEDFPAEEYVVINLLVCDGKLIGGDVSSRRIDGFMLPLTAG